MKKNILTIIIMAIVLINTILTALLIFTIVPTANKTNTLVAKVASIVDLELESPNSEDNISVDDIQTFNIPDKMTINLKSTDQKEHYLTVNVSLSMNTKNKDFTKYSETVKDHVIEMKDIIQDEISKYTKDEIQSNKEKIKDNILVKIQEYFKSDFIIKVYFGNLLIG